MATTTTRQPLPNNRVLKYQVTSGARQPLWMESEVPDVYPTLKQDETCDVTVIGGGISGLTTAYLLAEEGKKVVLLEDGLISSGETGRTTAHLQSAIDDRYFMIEKHHGEEGARAAAESHSMAIDLIERICKRENIDCDFRRLNGYLFLTPNDSIETLMKEERAAKKLGLDVKLINSVPFADVIGRNYGPCLQFAQQGQFHPTKYMRGLAEASTKNGVKIFTRTHAKHIEGGNPATVTSTDGYKVTSSSIVVATNVPVNDRITMTTKYEPYRTYAISGKIPKGKLPVGLYWDTGDPYHYVRLTRGQDENSDILIVGGEDHISGREFDQKERYQKLILWTKERFPYLETVDYVWSGHVIEPVDDVAFIGRNPGDKGNVFIITGDSGNGMTHGSLGGMLLTDMITGKRKYSTPAWDKLYDPSRKMTSEILEFIKHNAETQLEFKDYLTSGDIADIEDLRPGCGAIIRRGLTKHAVYRDEQGKVHEFSAVCPHLGCLVRWNEDEKSFCCPCHGSRFDAYGHVVNAPANDDLSPVKESQ